MAVGAMLCAVSFAVLAAGSCLYGVDDGADAPMLLIALTMTMLTVGELYLSPVGLSLISRCAAGAGTSTGLGLWFLATGIADVLGGAFSALYPVLPPSLFYLLCTILAATSALLLAWFTEALRQAALTERTLLGFPVSPAASPQPSPVAPRLRPPANGDDATSAGRSFTVRIT
eukprot:4213885-Prymnesium_polylepis.1